ncbi:transporter substrate-binding domain-containing protein [Psychroserpens sp. Hel_I_66]|uniref:transporter substrate-binding domain-containing protein n=1 Tax=Psychroserpens sp. Hel_I_66 TaxID=1250004 RepID=UPI001E578D82|nr:transporter substrate-binding domain-containing protein [Psychroserpens sp. Hel_I_66]
MNGQTVKDDVVSNKMNVGVYISPPFVIEIEGELSGMSIDLWQQIATHLNIDSNYKIYNSFQELVEATSKDSVSVAVTNLSINKERAQLIDFTQPWYDAGLTIMISESKGADSNELLKGLKEAGYIKSYLFLGVLVFLLTILMTFFDRRFDKEFPRGWKEGLSESFYQVMLMVTSGKLTRKNLFGWVGRIVSAIWLAVGILVVAYVTSTITSVMTSLHLSSDISQLSDLNDKKIAVLSGSNTEAFIRGIGFDYISYPNLNDMVDGIKTNQVDAIVGDAPVLEYYIFNNQQNELEIVGNLFKPDKYGFGLSPNNILKKDITLEILKAQESGLLRKLKSNYFGSSE